MQLYEDFSRVLWHGYKDLMPWATHLLGFDLGFLFTDDGKFEKGVIQFNTSHPRLIMQVCDYLRQNRMDWQCELSKFRNHYLEHRKADQLRFAKFYDPAMAEKLFTSVWETMADLLPVFIESHFTSSISIERIPDGERDPTDHKRFRYKWRGAPPLG
jgi:hypothetical protein